MREGNDPSWGSKITRQPKVGMTVRDERDLVVHTPLDQGQTAVFLQTLAGIVKDGYVLVGLDAIPGGTQRDPVCIGMRMHFKRPG